MNKYRVYWNQVEPGTHDRRQIFNRVFGHWDVDADTKEEAKMKFRDKFPGRKAGARLWYIATKIEKL